MVKLLHLSLLLKNNVYRFLLILDQRFVIIHLVLKLHTPIKENEVTPHLIFFLLLKAVACEIILSGCNDDIFSFLIAALYLTYDKCECHLNYTFKIRYSFEGIFCLFVPRYKLSIEINHSMYFKLNITLLYLSFIKNAK